MSTVYEVKGLGLWNTEKKQFVDSISDSDELIKVGISENLSKEEKIEEFKKFLEYEGFETKELTSEDAEFSILYNQNKEYLMKILMLYAMDVEVPESILEKFAKIRTNVQKLSEISVQKFIES